jgi:hypothetical protein
MLETNPTADAPYRTAISISSTLLMQHIFTRVGASGRKTSSWSIRTAKASQRRIEEFKQQIAILKASARLEQGSVARDLRAVALS